MGNRGSPIVCSRIGLEEVEFLFDKGGFAFVALGFDRRQAELGGEFAELGLQGVESLEGADGVALEEVPERQAELARHGHGGAVAPAAQGDGQAPLLQRVIDL